MQNSRRRWIWYLNPWRIVLWVLRRVFKFELTFVLDFIAQRVFGLNDDIPWPVHYTSYAFGDITIGRNCYLSFARAVDSYYNGMNGIIIGDDTIWACGVKIISANHKIDEPSGWERARPIEIGNHVWIASNVVVCPGVHIGDYAIIGANAVVTHDIPAYAVAVGVPARVIRFRQFGEGIKAQMEFQRRKLDGDEV